MKQLLTISIILLVSSYTAFAQDPAFSQPYANPLYLNPAFAGTGTSQRIAANFRDQWPNIPGNYITYSLSYDRNIIDSNFGIGMLAEQDRAGNNTLITTNVSAVFAYQFHIKSFTLSAGLKASFHEVALNGNLQFGDQIDPARGFTYNSNVSVNNKAIAPDFSAGILGYGKHYFAGFGVDHFTQPNESLISGGSSSPLPVKLTFDGGLIIPIGTVTLTPTLIYLKQQDFNIGFLQCYINYKWFVGALGYMYNVYNIPPRGIALGSVTYDALTFLLGFHIKRIQFAYSYDYYFSTELPNNPTIGGAHELSLGLKIPYKSDKLKKSTGLNCPLL